MNNELTNAKRAFLCLLSAVTISTSQMIKEAIQAASEDQEIPFNYAAENFGNKANAQIYDSTIEWDAEKYFQYYKACYDFKNKYFLNNSNGGTFEPFNHLGIDGNAFLDSHIMYDDEVNYLGKNAIDFNMISHFYLNGDYQVNNQKQKINTSEEYSDALYNIADKSLTFDMADGSNIIIFTEWKADRLIVKAQKRDNLGSLIEYYWVFKPENNNLVLSEEGIIQNVKFADNSYLESREILMDLTEKEFVNDTSLYFKNDEDYYIIVNNISQTDFRSRTRTLDNIDIPISQETLNEIREAFNSLNLEEARVTLENEIISQSIMYGVNKTFRISKKIQSR